LNTSSRSSKPTKPRPPSVRGRARRTSRPRNRDAAEDGTGRRAERRLERAFAGDSYVDRDLVFCDELGGPINPTRLTEAFLRHRKAAGIPTGTLHILRHTHTTHALSSGVPVHVDAAHIGDRPETVLKTYAHLLAPSAAEAAEQVAALIA
jgi:integrase